MKRIKVTTQASSQAAALAPGPWMGTSPGGGVGLDEALEYTIVIPQGDATLAVGDKVAAEEGAAPGWVIVALDQNGAVGIIFRIHNLALEYTAITISEPEPEPEPDEEPEPEPDEEPDEEN